MARNAEPSPARNAIILGNLVGFAAIAASDFWGLFSGARPLTKVFAVIHLLFAVALNWVGANEHVSQNKLGHAVSPKGWFCEVVSNQPAQPVTGSIEADVG